jgi:hypothetical protein
VFNNLFPQTNIIVEYNIHDGDHAYGNSSSAKEVFFDFNLEEVSLWLDATVGFLSTSLLLYNQVASTHGHLASCCRTASNSQLSRVQCPIIIPRMLDELLVVEKINYSLEHASNIWD